MEFEDVKGRVEWEARRVAAAFGAESFTASRYNSTLTDFHASYKGICLWWSLDSRREKTMLRVLDIKKGNQRCQVSVTNVLGSLVEEDRWMLIDQGVFREEMACWLYRLGFEEQSVLSQLPMLTMHEKIELRLSLPPKFWPKKWLEER